MFSFEYRSTCVSLKQSKVSFIYLLRFQGFDFSLRLGSVVFIILTTEFVSQWKKSLMVRFFP